MAGGSEGDALGGDGWVGAERVVGGDEAGNVDESGGKGELAGGVYGLRAHASRCPRCLIVDLCTIWDAGAGGK